MRRWTILMLAAALAVWAPAFAQIDIWHPPPVPAGWPRPLAQPPCIYPLSADLLRESGTTTMRFRIARDGAVRALALQTSSGSAALDGAALACVARYRYEPFRDHGAIVEKPWRFAMQWRLQPEDRDETQSSVTGRMYCAPFYRGDMARVHVRKPTVLTFPVNSAGLLAGGTVAASSGDARLDAAALDCVKGLRAKFAANMHRPYKITVEWPGPPIKMPDCDPPHICIP